MIKDIPTAKDFLQNVRVKDNMTGYQNSQPIYEFKIQFLPQLYLRFKLIGSAYFVGVSLKTYETSFISYPEQDILSLLYENRQAVNKHISHKQIKLRRC